MKKIIAINMRRFRSPWGGGNQWLSQVVRCLEAGGYDVRFDLRRPVDAILIAHCKSTISASFGLEDIRRYKQRFPEVRCLHRINENDQHRGTATIDRMLEEANAEADYTVFISGWVRDYHAARWFDLCRPHTVILNGADSRGFNPAPVGWQPGTPLRLVTHHWSDNWAKGFSVYQEIDRLIAEGALPETELWVIGRWPASIRWRAAKTFGPQRGRRLTNLLRACHVYVTASRYEAGGMHVIEGLQCGLPVLYHLDGGGYVEVAQAFGVGFRDDVRLAISQMRQRYPRLRRAVLERPPSGERMCEAYQQVIEHLLHSRIAQPTKETAAWTN